MSGQRNVNGPYRRRAGNPFFAYKATSFQAAQHVIALLWRWLSPPKRAQAARALRRVKEAG